MKGGVWAVGIYVALGVVEGVVGVVVDTPAAGTSVAQSPRYRYSAARPRVPCVMSSITWSCINFHSQRLAEVGDVFSTAAAGRHANQNGLSPARCWGSRHRATRFRTPRT